MIAEFIEVCIEEGTLLDEDGEYLSRWRLGPRLIVFVRVRALSSTRRAALGPSRDVRTSTVRRLYSYHGFRIFEYLDLIG